MKSGNIGDEYSTRKRLEESTRLEEFAIRDISRWGKQFEFKICIKDPETGHVRDPHAHLLNSQTNQDLMMRLKLFPRMPRSVADIQDAFPIAGKYKAIDDAWKPLILKWAKSPNIKVPSVSNWVNLWLQWCYSVNK
jgi:hypothetical protein